MDSIMGKRIREMREKNNLTMEELAQRLDVQKSAVSKWEHGRVQNIKRSTIEKMAEIFDCDPAWLMGFNLDDASQPIDNADDVSAAMVNLIELLNSMNETEQKKVLEYADLIKSARGKSSNLVPTTV